MNELVLANRAADWRRLKMLVLDSVSSPIYNLMFRELASVLNLLCSSDEIRIAIRPSRLQGSAPVLLASAR
jgi:hypothetical protein